MAQFESLIGANRAKSVVLVVLFILLYTALFFILAMTVAALAFGWAAVHEAGTVAYAVLISHILAVAMAIACYLGGPAMVISAVGARRVLRAEDEVLHDVVDEMAVAAGARPPAIYMIDSSAMNALATGLGPGKAAIIVTSGLRQRLTRDQLQGVVAYGMARIQNGDIHLVTVVAALMGFLVLAAEFYKLLFSSRDAWPVAIGILLIPWAIPMILVAPFLGRIIQLGVSRQRQFMADAAAARLTRYPESLAGALEIIASDTEPLLGASRATAPLFLMQPVTLDGDRMGGEGESAWSSHPTVAGRIARLRSLGNTEG